MNFVQSLNEVSTAVPWTVSFNSCAHCRVSISGFKLLSVIYCIPVADDQLEGRVLLSFRELKVPGYWSREDGLCVGRRAAENPLASSIVTLPLVIGKQ